MRGTINNLACRLTQFGGVVFIGLFIAFAMLGLHRFGQIYGVRDWPEVYIIEQQAKEIKKLRDQNEALRRQIKGPFLLETTPTDVH